LPFDFVIGAPTRHTVNDTTVGTAIATLLAINTANTPVRKAKKHTNSLKIQHSGILLTYFDRRLEVPNPTEVV
jgi:hypothetical protein